MNRALFFGGLTALVFLGFFVPTFILVFHGLATRAEVASVTSNQSTTLPAPHLNATLSGTVTPATIVSAGDTVTLGGHTFNADIVADAASRELGLSYRQNLPADNVMLFVFPSVSNWGIWMKGMNFPLDIFWLDSQGRVIYLKQNVSTSTYPTVFAPTNSAGALYVIEANAGTAASLGVSVGSVVGLPAHLSATN